MCTCILYHTTSLAGMFILPHEIDGFNGVQVEGGVGVEPSTFAQVANPRIFLYRPVHKRGKCMNEGGCDICINFICMYVCMYVCMYECICIYI